MFAKFHHSIERAAYLVLFALLTIAVIEANENYNGQQTDDLNARLLYDQPPVRYLHQSDGDQDAQLYNGQSSSQDPRHHHHAFEDADFPGYSNFADTDEDRSALDSRTNHQDLGPTANTFGETALSENITSTAISNTESFEQIGNNLPDKQLLTRELIKQTCQIDRGSGRKDKWNMAYLTYCSRYKLESLLSNEILMSILHHDSSDCERIMDEFIQLDETINQFDSLFMKLLSRYNCHNGYSVKWNCDDCKKAYRDWLCANHLPYYMNGERIKPCISFCERVEQRCPYLHPITREQYGGQPVFICRDPNIPFVPEITPDVPYSEPGKCYDLCHLSDNLTELIIDSLSRYDYDKCPDRKSIAEEVLRESAIVKNSGLQPSPSPELTDYHDQFEENAVVISNRTNSAGQSKVLLTHSERKKTHVHIKKLEGLREVLANYKNQAKTHRYHADHSSIEHSKSQNDLHSS